MNLAAFDHYLCFSSLQKESNGFAGLSLTHTRAHTHLQTHTHTKAYCTWMTDSEFSWGQLLTQGRIALETQIPMSWYWSCDYNSYLLKTEKLLSKLRNGGWGHRLGCRLTVTVHQGWNTEWNKSRWWRFDISGGRWSHTDNNHLPELLNSLFKLLKS